MKHHINSTPNIQCNKSCEKSYELKETILPSSYIISLAKELNSSKKGSRRIYPSLKDLLKFNSENLINPSDINSSLNFLTKGQIYCIENKKGNVEFLKFKKSQNPIPHQNVKSKRNYLNLDKIPIFTISNKKNDILRVKASKKEKYVIGFLNMEDALTYLNDIQIREKWKTSTKFYNLRQSQTKESKIIVSNLKAFYNIWANSDMKTILIPGLSNLGVKMYITKVPFYKLEGDNNIFLASFSKESLLRTLKESNLKSKNLISIETNKFFDLANSKFCKPGDYYFFLPHDNTNKNLSISGNDLKDLNKENSSELLTSTPSNLDLINSDFIWSSLSIFSLGLLSNETKIRLVSSCQTLFEKGIEELKIHRKKRSKIKKRRHKYIHLRFPKKRRTYRYFRKMDFYKKINNRDKIFLNSRKLGRLERYNKSILNNQKKWIRGINEINTARQYWGPSDRIQDKKRKYFNFDTWRLLKSLKLRKTLPAKKELFSRTKKRQLTSRKIWRLRRLFFKNISQKNQDFTDILKRSEFLIENFEKSSLKKRKDLGINEFLAKFKVLELENKRGKDGLTFFETLEIEKEKSREYLKK